MCGIVGFIDYNKKSEMSTLQKMTDVLHHRGPDDSGYSFSTHGNAHIGLGHRRLSIMDLSKHGHQPMLFQHWEVVYNGEIYNFKEIRESLKKDGFVFESDSDTEVILKSFDKWGLRAVDRFIGMFAFSIVNKEENKCYIVRDRAGVKPLYYYWKEGLFLFSSELKSLHEHPKFEKELNLDALAQYLQYGYILQPNSIFQNCFKLKAGHYLEVSLVSQEINEKKYWDVYEFYTKPLLELSEEEIISESEKRLKKAFHYRMVSDVPVGVFLSGGYDSSLVTALLQSDRRDKLNTFTIGFHEKGYDEAPYAKEVAQYLGTNHTEYYCTQEDAKKILPNLVEIYDEPFGDNSSIPTILVSQLARKDVTVALSADGGDEIFAGYSKHETILRFYNQYKKYPKFLKTAYALLLNSYGSVSKSYDLQRRLDKRSDILKANSIIELFKSTSQHYKREEIDKLFRHPTSDLKSAFDDGETVVDVKDELNKILAVDYKTYMNDNILTKVDRATMSTSLEGREPLLDHTIIEFMAQVDSKVKYKNKEKKYILKEITHKYLPKEMMDRPKKGFSVPLFTWFQDELKEYILHYLNKERLEREGIFNTELVLHKRDLYFEGKLTDINELWYILVFEMWYERWMEL
ncbi:MAG TPA: asparagine synthase (glutamine-hydrolyzing) [Arcobacter sp.]|nr:asparagine synthase (glutamine-hydrolyzing) [Arcobacter sp.]